jgi:hypothetical protein
LDRRTKAGRVFRTIEKDLTAHVGGAPSVVEKLLIQSASMKGTRLALLSEAVLEGRDLGNDGQVLAYANSLERTLITLGTKAAIKDISPSIEEILRDHAASNPKAAR